MQNVPKRSQGAQMVFKTWVLLPLASMSVYLTTCWRLGAFLAQKLSTSSPKVAPLAVTFEFESRKQGNVDFALFGFRQNAYACRL